MVRQTLLASAALVLFGVTGCATPFRVYLQAQDGTEARGTVERGCCGGAMTVMLDGRTFTGRWVGTQAGIFSNTRHKLALLRSPDGATLRCEYDHDLNAGSGIGECRDNEGKVFALQVGGG